MTLRSSITTEKGEEGGVSIARKEMKADLLTHSANSVVNADDLENLHPGSHLKLDYLPEMGVTEYRFAKLLGITQSHLADILVCRRSVTANIALRLGKLFDQSPEMWLSLQNKYDLARARREYGDDVSGIEPFTWPTGDKIAA
jgi:addiction module HigA family antidote